MQIRDFEGNAFLFVGCYGKVLLAFLLKENVPANEAEELVEKVRKKKVGELFANMEKMDIQAERKKTKRQEERADKAERRAEVAEQQAEKERQKAVVAKEDGIKILIESCRELSVSRELTLQKLVEKFNFSEKEALSRLERYWK